MPSKKRRISSGSGSSAVPTEAMRSPVAVAQRAGDGDDALQVQRQEIAAGRRAALLQRPVEDVGVGQARRQSVDAAQPGDVGDGLDVEDEDRRHAPERRASAGKTPVDR